MSRLRNLFQKAKWLEYDDPRVAAKAIPEYITTVSAADEIPLEEVRIAPTSRIVFHTDPQSPGAERFRLLRTRLRERREAGNLKRLLITSPLPHDGKSTVALNLATALSEGGN